RAGPAARRPEAAPRPPAPGDAARMEPLRRPADGRALREALRDAPRGRPGGPRARGRPPLGSAAHGPEDLPVKIAFFLHSAVSDWNHGNAHFLRGLMDALVRRGHDVTSWEPRDGWSARHLLREAGPEAVVRFARAYPALDARSYDPGSDGLRDRLEEVVRGRDLVGVHDWIEPGVVGTLAAIRREGGPPLLFHDTHHRAVSAPDRIGALPLASFDAVLAFGRALARVYDRDFGAQRV